MGKRYANVERIRGELGQKEALCRLLPFLKALWVPLSLGGLFTLALSAVNLGYGKIAKDALDAFTEHRQLSIVTLNHFLLAAAAVFCSRGFLYYGMNYAWTYAGQRLTLRLRNLIFRHLQEMSAAFFEHRKTGQLMACLSSDVQGVTSIFEALQDCISAPFVLIGGTLLLFWLNWVLALVSLVTLPPVALIIVWGVRRTKKYATRVQSSRAEVLDVAQESLSSFRVVKLFSNEGHEVRRFRQRSEAVFRSVLATTRVRLAMRPTLELLGGLSVLLVMWVGGQQIAADPSRFTIGALGWFAIVLQQVAGAAQDMGKILVNFSFAGVAADRVFTLLDMRSEVREKPDAVDLKQVTGRVEFDGVQFAYGAGIPVLDGITFTMEPGEVVAVVGPTGAGKTTIGALIPRLYDVTGGAVRIDGVDVRDCTLRSVRGQIGIVPQDTSLFSGTLRENIAYGRLEAPEEEIIAAARVANAWEFIEQLPEGLDTVIGERGVRLSGGQRQRIAIARAVLRDPRILILDEATSSLDARSESLVQEALQRLVANRTTLVIAHRLSTIRSADKIVALREGRIVEMGRHEELMARGGVYASLYRTQYQWAEPPPAAARPESDDVAEAGLAV